MITYPLTSPYRTHAGFGKRLGAYLVDMIIILLAALLLGFMLGIFLYILDVQDETTLNLCSNVFGLSLGWLYFAGMESSSYQATLGKMLLGIKVTDLAGDPISFGRATGRYLAKIISGLLFGIGYLMIAFTEDQQGLHDMMAGCLVISKE